MTKAGLPCYHTGSDVRLIDLTHQHCRVCEAIVAMDKNGVWRTTGQEMPKLPKPEKVEVGANIAKPLIWVQHTTLKRLDDGPFKSWCPVCDKGVMLVSRIPTTMRLSALDRCTLCGQAFVYEDTHIGGEPVDMPKPSTLEETVEVLDDWFQSGVVKNIRTVVKERWLLAKNGPLARHMQDTYAIFDPEEMARRILEFYTEQKRTNRFDLINSDDDL